MSETVPLPDLSDRRVLVEHDYTSFSGDEKLIAATVDRLGGVDDVLPPIGGWWHGKRLWEIDESEWDSVLAAELQDAERVFLLELGPVATRFVQAPDPAQVASAQIGAFAVAQIGAFAVAASASTQPGRHVRLLDRSQAEDALASLGAAL